MKYDYQNIILQDRLKYNEIKAILNYVNNIANKKQSIDIIQKFNKELTEKQGLKLTEKHFLKAYRFLIKNHFSKTGLIKPGSPFNENQIEILSDLQEVEILKFYNVGTIFKDIYTPLYRAKDKQGQSFRYFVHNNEIQTYSYEKSN